MTKKINPTAKNFPVAKASPKVALYAIVNLKTKKVDGSAYTRQGARETLSHLKDICHKDFAIFKMVAEKQVR